MSVDETIKQIVTDIVDARLASLPRQSSDPQDDETRARVAEYQVVSCKPYLTKQELTLYLDCSDRSVEEWSQRPPDKNPLPVGRAGRDLRFKRERVDEWMEREGERYWRQKNLKAAS